MERDVRSIISPRRSHVSPLLTLSRRRVSKCAPLPTLLSVVSIRCHRSISRAVSYLVADHAAERSAGDMCALLLWHRTLASLLPDHPRSASRNIPFVLVFDHSAGHASCWLGSLRARTFSEHGAVEVTCRSLCHARRHRRRKSPVLHARTRYQDVQAALHAVDIASQASVTPDVTPPLVWCP